MKLRGRRKKSKPKLMLTSLLDMFTIILLFLLVNFDAENKEFKKNDSVDLPSSTARNAFKPATNVAVTLDGIVLYAIDDTKKVKPRTIVQFQNGKPSAEAFEAGKFPDLVEVLERILDKRQENSQNPDEESIVMIQADRRLEYRTLYLVMRSAREAGFDKHRLVVMKK